MNKIAVHRDSLSGITLIGISIWLWTQTQSFPQLDDGYPGPALFPQLIATGLGLSGLLLGVRSIKRKMPSPKKVPASPFSLKGLVRLLTGLGLIVLYPIMVEYVHFIPVMACLILFFGLLLKNEAWHALLMAVLSAALMYSMFTHLLKVPL